MSLGIWLYLAVLVAYLPGLVVLFKSRNVWSFPLLAFTFLGMFLFNFVGSFNVFMLHNTYWLNFDRNEVLVEYAFLLALQAIIYYGAVGLYVFKRKRPHLKLEVTPFDNYYIGAGLLLICFLVIGYYLETGHFLLSFFLRGDLNINNAYEYRMKYIYGLKNWPIYNIGFTVLPTFISSYSLLRAKVSKRFDGYFYLSMGICFLTSLSMGSKAGLFNFILTLSIAYVVFLNASKESVFKIFNNRYLWGFSAVIFSLLVLGYFHAIPEKLSISRFFSLFWYRLAVTYTETIAGAISYTKHIGFLGVSVFPNARGLLPHEYANLPLLMHQYISNSPGGMNTPFIAEAFLVSGWLSAIYITLIISGVLIALQECIIRLKIGVVGLAFAAFYSYMGILLTILGMTSTFLTFMYPAAFVTLAIMALSGQYLEQVIYRFNKFRSQDTLERES